MNKKQTSIIFSISKGTYSHIKLSWTSMLGISKYKVARSQSKNGPFKLIKIIHTDPVNQPPMIHLNDKGVLLKTNYYYKLEGHNDEGLNFAISDKGIGK